MESQIQAQDFIHPSNARLSPTLREKLKVGALFGLAAGLICGAALITPKALLFAALGTGVMKAINKHVSNSQPLPKDMGQLNPAMEARRTFVKEEAKKILSAMGKTSPKEIKVIVADELDQPVVVYSTSKGIAIATAEMFVGVEDEETIKGLLAHRLAHKALGHTKKKKALCELAAGASLAAAMAVPVTTLPAMVGAGLAAAAGPKIFAKLYTYLCDYQADRIGAAYSKAPDALRRYIESFSEPRYIPYGETSEERIRTRLALALQRPIMACFQAFSDSPHPLERGHRLGSIGEKQGIVRDMVRDIKLLPRMTRLYKVMPKP